MSDDRIKLTGEKAFNNIFFDMVNRVLTVKKGVAVADRVVKFVANYVSYCTGTGMPFLIIFFCTMNLTISFRCC